MYQVPTDFDVAAVDPSVRRCTRSICPSIGFFLSAVATIDFAAGRYRGRSIKSSAYLNAALWLLGVLASCHLLGPWRIPERFWIVCTSIARFGPFQLGFRWSISNVSAKWASSFTVLTTCDLVNPCRTARYTPGTRVWCQCYTTHRTSLGCF